MALTSKKYCNFTRYIGQLSCMSDGSLIFEVFAIEPAGSSPHQSIGKSPWDYRFDSCVVLDDNILSRLEMNIDWSKITNRTYTRSFLNE